MTRTMLTKLTAVLAALVLAGGIATPAPANAMMKLGNYDLLTNRYDRASWVWFITNCFPPDKQPDCVHVSARPRLKFYAYYEAPPSSSTGATR